MDLELSPTDGRARRRLLHELCELGYAAEAGAASARLAYAATVRVTGLDEAQAERVLRLVRDLDPGADVRGPAAVVATGSRPR